MAFNDTLFQLGMDLTRSSTAQKEDHSFVESVAERPVSEAEMAPKASAGHAGYHLIIDLHGAGRLIDAKSAERGMKSALLSLGKLPSSVHVSRVADGSLSGVAVLAVGHLSFQGNPKTGFAAIDVRGCVELDPHAAMFALADAFGAREAVIQKTRAADVVFLPAAKQPEKVRARAAKAPAGAEVKAQVKTKTQARAA
jgi:S-adenosylmethionine decarboxylase